MAAAPAASHEQQPSESFLVIFNVGKRQNWGTLLRSACAFGVAEVLVVGAKKLATFGNQGTTLHANQRYFDSLAEAKDALVARGARLCGVEITDTAEPIQSHPFRGPTAFMLGNEGQGMTPAQLAACDFFVYVPQHTGATASLNVAVAGAIVLHHFALWAGLQEQPRAGSKFVTAPARGSLERYRDPTDAEREEIERKRAERAAKRKLADDDETAEDAAASSAGDPAGMPMEGAADDDEALEGEGLDEDGS